MPRYPVEYEQRYHSSIEDFLRSPKWVQVTSSNVHSIRYDRPRRELHVRFLTGMTRQPARSYYTYSSVPPHVAADMLQAPSKGRFVHYRLKKQYVYRRVTG